MQNVPSGIKLYRYLYNHKVAKLCQQSYLIEFFKFSLRLISSEARIPKEIDHFQVDQHKASILDSFKVNGNIICAMVAGKLLCSYWRIFGMCTHT